MLKITDASPTKKSRPAFQTALGLTGILGVFLLHCGFSGLSDLWPLLVLVGISYFIVSFCFVSVGLAILAVAMLFSPEISVGAIASRAITLRIEDILIPALVLAWVAKNAVQTHGALIMRSPLNKPIGGLLLVMFVSTGIGYFRGDVLLLPGIFYTAKIIEYFVIFFLTLNYIRNEKQVRFFLIFALITVAALVMYTLPQVPNTQIFSANRISAPFETTPQPSTAGGYLAFSFFIVFSLMLYQKSLVRKIVLGIFSLLIFIPILYTLNRATYLMVFMGVILLSWMSGIKWLRVVLVFVVILAPLIAPDKVKERIAFTWLDAKNPDRNMGVDMSSQERIYSFQRAMYGLQRNPLIGSGMASWDYPDNQYSRTLVELGILGLGLWLWIFWRLYWISRWIFSVSDGTVKGLSLGYAAGIFGLLFHALGSCTFYIVRIMEPFWFMSGLIAALYALKIRDLYPHAGGEDL